MNATLKDLNPSILSVGIEPGNSFNSTHLLQLGGNKPHNLDGASSALAMFFAGTDRYDDKPLVGKLEGKNNKMYLDNDYYTWSLNTHTYEKARVVAVVTTSIKPGLNNTEFDIVLDSPQFMEPDVLMGPTNKWLLKVIGRGRRHSTGGTVYTVKLQTNDALAYYPSEYIQEDQEFHKVATAVSNEQNQDYGTMNFESVLSLRNHTANVAEKVEVTDKMIRAELKRNKNKGTRNIITPMEFKDRNGNTVKHNTFIGYLESKALNNIYRGIEYQMTFSKPSIEQNAQGYNVKTIPGLRHIMEETNKITHQGNMSLMRMEERLLSIYRGRTDARPGDRDVILSGGEMSSFMWNNMIADEASNFTTIDSNFIERIDARNLAYGAQFTRYKGKNHLDVTFEYDVTKDNELFCPQTHPQHTDIPIDSWRMEIMDLGKARNVEGVAHPNMQMVAEDMADYYFCDAGKWNMKTGTPSPKNSGEMGKSNPSGYSVHFEKSYGLLVRDPSRFMVFAYELNDMV